MDSIHFSSNSYEWQTPKEFFDKLDAEFHFELDAAATEANALCADFFTPEDDALAQPWHVYNSVWCNPPYGRVVGKFVKKGYEESQKGCTVVMLVPSRTDTKWWHSYVAKGEVRLVRGRLKFKDPLSSKDNPAPFPSAVVIFSKDISPTVKFGC